MTTVAIIDDHALFRAGISQLMSRHDFTVVAEAGDSGGALRAVGLDPDVLVLDLALADADGIEVARALRRLKPDLRVLALSAYAESERVARAFDAGILGYATKVQSPEEVLEAVRTVANGNRYLAPELAAGVALGTLAPSETPAAPPHPAWALLNDLTAREREIFELLLRGLRTNDVSRQLFISPRTVETHRGRILRKLHVRNAVELVRLGAQLGILPI